MRSFFSKMKTEERGYILLLSILVTSIILAISFGIYAIGIKEVILSSYLRDSQQAFAAADRALECALTWDVPYKDPLDPDGSGPGQGLRWSVFATGTVVEGPHVSLGSYQYPTEALLNQVVCGDQKIFPVGGDTTADRPTANISCPSDVPSEPANSWCVQGNAGNMETRFLVKFGGSDRSCAYVSVTKQVGRTVFRSDGYNDCNPANSRRTQRTIEVTSNG